MYIESVVIYPSLNVIFCMSVCLNVCVCVRFSDERPMNLRVVSQNMPEGDLPLGKQLANELKRHHNHNHNHNNHNTDETKTPATGQDEELITPHCLVHLCSIGVLSWFLVIFKHGIF